MASSAGTGGKSGRPQELLWFKFHMSWAKWFAEDADPNMSILTDAELGRCMRRLLKFVATNATEQVNGNERWLYTEMVRDIREDWDKVAAASANRSEGQKGRQAGSDAQKEIPQISQISEISEISQISQISQISEKGQIAGLSTQDIDIERDIEKISDIEGETEQTSVSPEREKEKIKKEKARAPSQGSRRPAKAVREQMYEQPPNRENGMEDIPEWVIKYRDQLTS